GDRDGIARLRRLAVVDTQTAVAGERDVDRSIEVELAGRRRRGVSAREREDRRDRERRAIEHAAGPDHLRTVPIRSTTRLWFFDPGAVSMTATVSSRKFVTSRRFAAFAA